MSERLGGAARERDGGRADGARWRQIFLSLVPKGVRIFCGLASAAVAKGEGVLVLPCFQTTTESLTLSKHSQEKISVDRSK